jgi:hypothetical protein
LIPDLPDATFYERELEGEHLEIVTRLEPRSLMCVPLLARGKTRGAITLVSSKLDRRYGEEDLLLAENLAYRCALAADNARLYRDRSEIARVLQRSLLPPHLPEIPGVEVGAEYLPVGEANDVGGDFYDLINTVEDGWLCAIGDVRGKGVEAASVTALARYTIRAVTLKNDRPSEVLAALNEAMLRQLPEDRFCTAACVRLEPQDGSAGVGVDVSRAGHPPPLLVRPEGTVEEVGCSGRVLGVFPEAELRDTSLRLMPGEALVLYTDGVTEARSPDGDFFGEGRLRDLLSSCAGCDAVTFARTPSWISRRATRATTSPSWSYAPVTERRLRREASTPSPTAAEAAATSWMVQIRAGRRAPSSVPATMGLNPQATPKQAPKRPR